MKLLYFSEKLFFLFTFSFLAASAINFILAKLCVFFFVLCVCLCMLGKNKYLCVCVCVCVCLAFPFSFVLLCQSFFLSVILVCHSLFKNYFCLACGFIWYSFFPEPSLTQNRCVKMNTNIIYKLFVDDVFGNCANAIENMWEIFRYHNMKNSCCGNIKLTHCVPIEIMWIMCLSVCLSIFSVFLSPHFQKEWGIYDTGRGREERNWRGMREM